MENKILINSQNIMFYGMIKQMFKFISLPIYHNFDKDV